MRYFLFIASWLLFLPLAQGQPQQDEASVRQVIQLRVAELWEKEDFAQLDKMGAEYRKSRSRTPSGIWRLSVFHGALTEQVSSNIDKPGLWQFMEDRAKKWTVRSPDSPFAHLQYAQA